MKLLSQQEQRHVAIIEDSLVNRDNNIRIKVRLLINNKESFPILYAYLQFKPNALTKNNFFCAGQQLIFSGRSKPVHSLLNEGGFDLQRYAISQRLLGTFNVQNFTIHEFRNLQKRSINLKTRKNQGVHILSGYPCIKDIYKTFLQVSSLRYSGLALSEVSPSPLSHDTVSRWLKSRCFRPKDLWRLVEPSIDKKSPCVLIADDTLIAKTRSKKIEMVHYQYSGNEHDVIAGIGLVNLLWHDLTKVESIPINYLIYDKDSDGKTKNTHFSEMLTLAKKRGIMPEVVVMDAWYSSLDNLKSIRSHGWIWVNTLRKNRIVNHNKQLNKLDISEEGTSIHLRGYGWVTVFKFTAKNGRIDYIVTNKENPTRQYLKSIMDARWSVEVYHREVKQNCGIERCQARTSRAQRNHIFLAISAWFEQHKRRISEKITLYQQNWDVIKSAITEQIRVLLAYPN